jgi:protein-tyrosine phosphatase
VELSLEGAPNTRDVANASALLRPGRLYRASALGRLTDADVAALERLGLRTVVDFRNVSEIALAPPDRLAEPALDVVKLPIYDPRHPVFTYVSAVLLGEDHGADYAALAEEGTPGAMLAIYRWFVSAATARAQFSAALRLIADPARLPALVHCSAGKDRTGWFVALALAIAGVDRASIEADYLATNRASAEVNETILRAMKERRPGLDPEALRPVFEARPEYLAAAYAEVVRLYRTMDAFMRDGLGLSAAELAAVRANLTT